MPASSTSPPPSPSPASASPSPASSPSTSPTTTPSPTPLTVPPSSWSTSSHSATPRPSPGTPDRREARIHSPHPEERKILNPRLLPRLHYGAGGGDSPQELGSAAIHEFSTRISGREGTSVGVGPIQSGASKLNFRGFVFLIH
ncbi:unnamed protein product [Linum tenue]|uniref:Uncharacterized protein n=1 Tax=Linum tenue TaxID=586396 RepID=A0AAV0PSP6_9ROSI|nr:unnamed protein product [Linum tenue]